MSSSMLLIGKLKSFLKLKNITYSELAKKLDVSEATVKRWFSTENLSLKQLDSVCVQLETSLEEIINLEKKDTVQEFFNQEQESAFDENEKLLVLFYLISGGASIENLTTSYRYTKKEIEKLALKLDQLNIIDYLPNNKFRLKTPISTLWRPSGVLSKKYFHLIREDFMNTYFDSNDEKQWFYYGRLSKSNSDVIQKKIDDLAKEIKELYRIDKKDSSLPSRSLFIGFRPWDFNLVKKYRRQ